MTTALESRPKLQDGLKIIRHELKDGVRYMVREPVNRGFYRFDELTITIVRAINGERTAQEIANVVAEELGVRPAAGSIADLVHKLKRMGIVERTPAEEHMMAMERLRRKRKIRARRRVKGSIVELQVPFGDPNQLFGRMAERIGWIWSRGFVAISMLFFATYFVVTALKWEEFTQGAIALYTLNGISGWDILLLILITLIITVIHELGHGLTTRHFGGEVHDTGFFLLYFSPAFYVDTTDAWTMKRAHRLWVTFGGPWIELMVAAAAGVVWATTEPGTFINWVAFLAFLTGGISSILSNLNPLLPLDGYYALMDLLEIPDLRQRAFAYWGWLFKAYVLGVEAKEPRVTPRERRAMLVYGALAFLYSVFIALVGLLWLILVFGRFIGPWIWVIVTLLAIKMVRKHAGRSRSLAVAAQTRWRAGFLSGPRAGVLAIVVVTVIALPFILPWTYRARGEFTVEAAPPAPVRAQVDGIIDRILVNEGDAVASGEPLVVLWNPDLESAFLDRQAEARRLAVGKARAEARGDLSGAAEASATLSEVNDELEVLRARRARLVVRAPIEGTVLGYRLRERLGDRLLEGEELVTIASNDGRLARVRIPLKRAGELEVGQPAGLRLLTRPDLEFRSTVASLAPAAEDGTVETIVYFPPGDWQPAPGMSGVAKIVTRRATVAHAIARAWRQTVRIDLWL